MTSPPSSYLHTCPSTIFVNRPKNYDSFPINRRDDRTVLILRTTRKFFAEVGTNERSFQQPGSLVGRSLQCRTKALASHSLGSRTGIRSLRVRADGIERVAAFDPMSSTAEVDAREADDKDGVQITGRYGWGTSTACTPGKCA